MRSKSSAAPSDDKNRLQKMFGSIGKGKAATLLAEPLSPHSKGVPHPDRVLAKLTKVSKDMLMTS